MITNILMVSSNFAWPKDLPGKLVFKIYGQIAYLLLA